MIARMVVRNLAHRPIRTFLSVLAVAVEVAMILLIVGLSEGLLQESMRRTKGVGADILIHGHEPCEDGFSAPNERQIILDGCCSHAAYLIVPVAQKLTHREIVGRIQSLHQPALRSSRN